jgi:dienelactone hydrolase
VRHRLAVAALLGALLIAGPASADAATVRNYDLGVVSMPDPGPKGPIPIRLWGAIGVPGGPGPHPLVIVAHGRHGDNCPIGPGDAPTWPCFNREQRNDLGLGHIVKALARRGVAAVSPDLNGAYTAGWGEPNDPLRWRRIVLRTIEEIRADVTSGGSHFGIQLGGRIRMGRIGLLGHSLSGLNALRMARTGAPFRSLFLLAPVFGSALPRDMETVVVAARCDADVGGEPRRFFEQAQRQEGRDGPVFFIRLEGANHNFFNRTLSGLRREDGRVGQAPGCRRQDRLTAGQQQNWIDRAGGAFFAAELRGADRPRWMQLSGRIVRRIAGLPVLLRRLVP